MTIDLILAFAVLFYSGYMYYTSRKRAYLFSFFAVLTGLLVWMLMF